MILVAIVVTPCLPCQRHAYAGWQVTSARRPRAPRSTTPFSGSTGLGRSDSREPGGEVGVVDAALPARSALHAPLHVVEVDLRDGVLDHRPDSPPDARDDLVEHQSAEEPLVHGAAVGLDDEPLLLAGEGVLHDEIAEIE